MAVDGIKVRYQDREDGHTIVLDVTNDRVDFAGFVFTEDEAIDLSQQLHEAVQAARVSKQFGK